MKKLRLIVLALLAAGGLNAQYFQGAYGTASNEILESGVNTIMPRGKLMAGYTDFINPGLSAVVVTRTNAAGAVGGAPTFNGGYVLFDGISGAQLNAHARRVIELANGRLLVWGDFTDIFNGMSDRFFLMELNNNGTVIYIRSYNLPYPVMEVEATSMVESISKMDTVFVCGWARNSAGSYEPVAMSIAAATGNPAWAWSYVDATNPGSDWTANDLEESPFPTMSGVPDVGLVGRYAAVAGGIGDGSFYTVSAATGFPTNFVYRYGTAASEESLNGITVAFNGLGSGPGFAVCGTAFNTLILPASFSTWAMKINPSGSIVNWTTLVDYSIPGSDDVGNDIIERVDSLGAFEYYVGGTAAIGLFGGSDAIVYKLNMGGGLIPNGQFTYGGGGNEDCRQVGKEIGPGPIGLSVFGNTNGSFGGVPGAADFYDVKAYFNGITACNFDVRNAPMLGAPIKYDSIMANAPNPFMSSKVIWQTFNLNSAYICGPVGAIAGGSNARHAAENSLAEATVTQVYPNPVDASNAVVHISFADGGASRDVEVELWNTLGQLCLQQKLSVAEGETEKQVNLGSGLSSGLYHLVLRQNGQVTDYKISVQ